MLQSFCWRLNYEFTINISFSNLAGGPVISVIVLFGECRSCVNSCPNLKQGSLHLYSPEMWIVFPGVMADFRPTWCEMYHIQTEFGKKCLRWCSPYALSKSTDRGTGKRSVKWPRGEHCLGLLFPNASKEVKVLEVRL